MRNARKRIEAHDTRITRWVDRQELAWNTCLQCIDGRQAGGRIGAPGGDLGELLLIAAAAEDVRERRLSDDWMRRAMSTIAARRGRFYMHTDRVSLRRLYAAGMGDAGYAEENVAVTAIPRRYRQGLARVVSVPETAGCGHIRMMLAMPRIYGIRRELVVSAIESFYMLLWEGRDEMRLDVLSGASRESTLLFVGSVDDADGAAEFPVVEVGGASAFVEHPGARRVVRDAFIETLDSRGLLGGASDVEQIRRRIDPLEFRHREATLAMLAPEVRRERIHSSFSCLESKVS
jgi:hypothetical protein